MDPKKEVEKTKPEDSVTIRIMLTGTDCKAIEKMSTSVVDKIKSQKLQPRGPRRFPVKTLRITTRKSPCGNGTNSWHRFQMRIYKRIIEVAGSSNIVPMITKLYVEPGTDVEISILKN